MNGFYTLTQGTTFGSRATYMCQAGFKLVNLASNLTCGSSSQYSGSSSQWIGTQPECEIIDCGQPSDVKNGSFSLSSGTHYGSIGTATCVAGYEINESANIMCDINGDWNGSFPDCTPVDCGSVQNIENGNATLTGTTFGHTATYNCVSGFELVGPNLLTCNASSEWEPYKPNCVADCGPPTQIMNGSYTLSQGTTLSSTATYQCQAGFQLAKGNSSLICDENSQWIGSQPECEIIECGQPPDVKNGSFSLSSGTQYGSIGTATCVEGYEIHETANIMCGDNGNWNGSLSDCAPVDCGSAQNISNGHVASTGTTFGHTATYYCITGFALAGPNLVKCNASAEWEPYVPSCQVKNTSIESVPKKLYIMPCICYNKTFTGLTEEQIIAQLIRNMSIDTRNTSMALNKLRCRQDDRPFCVITGYITIGVIGGMFLLLVLSDVPRLIHDFRFYF
ncbi:sushi, von Willebrand factor type A, EGF and pentraxin domain-containing protein 1-like [Dreissena polymorpha]|nr:sushi, von Willebrand factor type A, EGF and pentraxin domain-containing protein 1-like [Dreissena polymorpha]